MKTITFFSYKGGVGRTLAATNFAVYLAKLGLKVIVLDFDLDAPGVDSKFPDFSLPQGQLGIIDYILEFQRHGTPPGPINEIYCEVPLTSPQRECTVGLIPAGDYLAPDYSAKLNELNWTKIFADERGVAFFQYFLERIANELSPDVLVVDSRTGFSEIGGLCTQQLADETVILSSLAAESIKMTRHLAQVIRESEIAQRLNKPVETKIVVSRVPKPNRGLEKLKKQCCKNFCVDEKSLFFLFSCPALEREEFVAMLDTQKEAALVSSYLQLFQGLDVEVAQESIKSEIERTEQGLLSYSPDEAESRIREMVALYPHPEVYRRAMRFFELRRRPDEAVKFSLHLLELAPDDQEAQMQVTNYLLDDNFPSKSRFIRGKVVHFLEDQETNIQQLLTIAERVYTSGKLTVAQKVHLADLLEDADEDAKSYAIASECLQSDDLDDADLRMSTIGIAVRTAMQIGKRESAAALIEDIPTSQLRGGVARAAIQLKMQAGEKEEAFEIAKSVLLKDLSPMIVGMAASLAQELGRAAELEKIIRSNPELESVVMTNPEFLWQLEREGFDVSELNERARVSRRRRIRPGKFDQP